MLPQHPTSPLDPSSAGAAGAAPLLCALCQLLAGLVPCANRIALFQGDNSDGMPKPSCWSKVDKTIQWTIGTS